MSISDFESRLQERFKDLVSVHSGSFQQELNSLQASVKGAIQDSVDRLLAENFGKIAQLSQTIKKVAEDPSLTSLASEVVKDLQIRLQEAESARKRAEEALEIAKQQPAKPNLDLTLLKTAIQDIQVNRTQADVLSTLVSYCAKFAPRVALFVVKSGNVVGWMACGLEDGKGNESVKGQAISLQTETLLKKVLSKQTTFSEEPDIHSDNIALLSIFGDTKPSCIAGIPLVVRNKAAAVLYADSGNASNDSINLEALEILVNIAGLTVELISVRPKGGDGQVAMNQSMSGQAIPPAAKQLIQQMSKPSETPKVPEVAAAKEAKEKETVSEVSEETVQESVKEEASRAFTDISQTTKLVEVVEKETPKTVEEVTAVSEPAGEIKETAEKTESEEVKATGIETSEAVSQQRTEPKEQGFNFSFPPAETSPSQVTVPSPAPAPVFGQLEKPFTLEPRSEDDKPTQRSLQKLQGAPPTPTNEEEQKLHNDAKRFARLLVSEIKLYNEDKVKDGRKNMNLYDQLKEDIDRSRQMYDKRVSAVVAASFDYFYDELVNTLAEGDVMKLGRDYPGPSIQVL